MLKKFLLLLSIIFSLNILVYANDTDTISLMSDSEVEEFINELGYDPSVTDDSIETNQRLNGMLLAKYLKTGSYTLIYSHNNTFSTNPIKLAYPSGDSIYVDMVLYTGDGRYYSSRVYKGTIKYTGLINGAFDGRLRVYAKPSSTGYHNFKIFDF